MTPTYPHTLTQTHNEAMAHAGSRSPWGRHGFALLALAYLALVAGCLWSLGAAGDLTLGRHPWANLSKTWSEFARPSFLDTLLGPTQLEYRSEDGTLLRLENRQQVEWDYLAALLRATWATLQIATLGSLLGAVLALPLAALSARNLPSPQALSWLAHATLNVARSIHTLVFGLVLVGIVGLGPTAGILAIGLHSMGSYGKLFSEAIESLDMAAIHAVQSVGASRSQVFFLAVWPTVLPQFVSCHLYLWEFNIRDSTILGIIGAGGLGLLISEAISLFQWSRLATVLLVLVAVVVSFDAASRRVRRALA